MRAMETQLVTFVSNTDTRIKRRVPSAECCCVWSPQYFSYVSSRYRYDTCLLLPIPARIKRTALLQRCQTSLCFMVSWSGGGIMALLELIMHEIQVQCGLCAKTKGIKSLSDPFNSLSSFKHNFLHRSRPSIHSHRVSIVRKIYYEMASSIIVNGNAFNTSDSLVKSKDASGSNYIYIQCNRILKESGKQDLAKIGKLP